MREVRIDRNMRPMTYSQARAELRERREARDEFLEFCDAIEGFGCYNDCVYCGAEDCKVNHYVEVEVTGRESSEQECLGCGHVIRASRWFIHSQECILLEAIVELALAARLDIQQLGEMSDE